MLSNVVAYMFSVLDLYPTSACLFKDAKFAGLDVRVGEDSILFLFSKDEVVDIQEACVEANAAERPYLHGALYVVSKLLDAFNPNEAE